MASRTSILETIKNVADKNPTIRPKSTISSFEKFFFDIRTCFSNHPLISIGAVVGLLLGTFWFMRRRRRGGRGYFRLDEKEGLLGGGGGGKVD
jgi:protein disulfide-isomerase